MHEHDPQVGRHEPAPAAHRHVVTLADVVDVHRDGRVRADAVLLHQRDHLGG